MAKYKKMTILEFNELHDEFKNFRDNCYGENMTALFEALERKYLPSNEQMKIITQYTITEGRAVPDKLFAKAQTSSSLYDLKDPTVAIKVQTALSLLTQRTPDVRWDAMGDYKKKTPVINSLRARDWRDEESRQQYAMTWFFDALYGTTFKQRTWFEEERNVRLPASIDPVTKRTKFKRRKIIRGKISRLRALSPLQVWIDPNTQPMKPSSMRRVFYEDYFTLQDFKRQFKNMPNFDISKIEGATFKDRGDGLWVHVRYYENMDEDRLVVVANENEDPIYDGPLLFNHKELSIDMAIWYPRGRNNPYGIGPVEMMEDDMFALNELKNMILSQIKFSIFKPVISEVPLKSNDGATDITVRPDEILVSAGKVQFMEVPPAGQEAWKSLEYLRTRVDDSSGITRTLGGELTTNATAFQTDLAKDAALARLSIPIANMVMMLSRDAKLGFELQRQYLSLPTLEQITTDEQLADLKERIQLSRDTGEPVDFDLFEDSSDPENPVAYKGTYNKVDLAVQESNGMFLPSSGTNEVLLTPDVFDWEGDAYVIADSLLTITPTLDKVRELEMMNLLVPMFGKPPDLVAKSAREITKIYGKQPEDYLPESFLQYLESLESGVPPAPSMPQMPPEGAPPMQAQDGSLAFEQTGLPKVATGFNGTNNAIASRSQVINRMK